MSTPVTLDRFIVSIAVTIRLCQEADLPLLEWFGLFTAHREIIRTAFERQRRGENLMLVAVENGFPVAQAWVDLTRYDDRGAGLLWAVRVFPAFRGKGIGRRLITLAERLLRERGFSAAEIGVEKHNGDALRLYERLGYRITREEHEEYSYVTPDGTAVRVPVDEWMLHKALDEPEGEEPERGESARASHEHRTVRSHR